MKKIIIYSKNYCPYCSHAKRLLEEKGLSYEEINLENDPEKLMSLLKETGMRTVPQIYVGDTFVGGFSELSEINQSGELDKILNEK